MDNKLELYENKLNADFNMRFASDFLQRKQAIKMMRKAKSQRKLAERRMAMKYGYTRMRSSWVRSRSRSRFSE